MRNARNIPLCVSPEIHRQTRHLAAGCDTTVSAIVAVSGTPGPICQPSARWVPPSPLLATPRSLSPPGSLTQNPAVRL